MSEHDDFLEWATDILVSNPEVHFLLRALNTQKLIQAAAELQEDDG